MAERIAHGRKPDAPHSQEDAFVAGALRLWRWLQHNLRSAILITGGLAILVGGILYYRGYRATVRERAAAELSQLRGMAGGTEPAALTSQLEGFIERFSGTVSEAEARLVLARLYIDGGRSQDAIRVLEGVGLPVDVPLGFGARTLLTIAYEQNGEPERALALFQELGSSARYPFQRRQASASAARILTDLGRMEEAVAIYARIAEEAADNPSEAGLYRIRLGELRGRLTESSGS
jgi:predicted negative regulator of RcsB-dependent stress response